MEKNILIYGEFPPNTHTGISICNQMVKDILSNTEQAIEQVEEDSWSKNAFQKISHHFFNYFKVLRLVLGKPFSIFYFNLPLSVFAMFKIMPIILIVRTCSRRTQIFAHLHRGDFKSFIDNKKRNKSLLKFYLKRLTKLIVLSEDFVRDIQAIAPHLKIDVLHNTSVFEGEKLPQKQYAARYVCIANYIESKGIKELFDVFNIKQFNKLNLTLYGNAYDTALINKMQATCPTNIHIKGPLQHKQILNCLHECDCLILPSWNEGQPIIILEAMSLGIPVIATNVGDIPNMLGENYKYLALPKNKQNMEECIEHFHNSEEKDEISAYLYQRYIQNYSNSIFSKTLLEIFE